MIIPIFIPIGGGGYNNVKLWHLAFGISVVLTMITIMITIFLPKIFDGSFCNESGNYTEGYAKCQSLTQPIALILPISNVAAWGLVVLLRYVEKSEKEESARSRNEDNWDE